MKHLYSVMFLFTIWLYFVGTVSYMIPVTLWTGLFCVAIYLDVINQMYREKLKVVVGSDVITPSRVMNK